MVAHALIVALLGVGQTHAQVGDSANGETVEVATNISSILARSQHEGNEHD